MKKILFAAAGLVLVVLGAILFVKTGDNSTYKGALFLDQPVIDGENEGKNVIITGNLTVVIPAYDEKYGITIDAPVATRNSEKKKKIITDGVENVKWEACGCSYIYGEVKLGGFVISPELLNRMELTGLWESFDADETAAYDVDGEYLTDGDVRVYYRYAAGKSYTLAGRQVGDRLELSDETLSFSVSEGISNREDVVEHKPGVNYLLAVVVICIGAPMVLIAVIPAVSKNGVGKKGTKGKTAKKTGAAVHRK